MSETPFPVSAPPPDAASLAALLQSAAQALLRSGKPSRRRTPRACEGRANPRGNPPLSISSFGCALRKELLEEEDAEEMQGIAVQSSSLSLETFADLLELMNPEAKVEGVVMHTLARELRRIGRLVFKIQDAYSTVELVEA